MLCFFFVVFYVVFFLEKGPTRVGHAAQTSESADEDDDDDDEDDDEDDQEELDHDQALRNALVDYYKETLDEESI